MFTVIYTNRYNKQFSEDFVFKTIDDAREYLTKNGYTESNRIFKKELPHFKSTAHIHPLTEWKGMVL